MKTRFRILIGLLALFFIDNQLFSQPANDEIANATKISVLPYADNAVDFTTADTEGPVPASDGPCNTSIPMVWYKFTFMLGANLTISASNGSSVIIIYAAPNESASDFSTFTALQPCANSASVGYTTSPGQTYYVMIGKSSISDITFSGTFIPPPPPPPPNDEIVDAIEISEFSYLDSQVNFPQADTEGPLPASDGPCYSYDPMVWYKFTTSASGVVGVFSPTSTYVVAIFYTSANQNATNISDLNPVTPCQGSIFGIGTNVIANQTYYVMVGANSTTDITFTGDGVLPVELSEFTAKPVDEQVKLTWETSSEINNEGFFVERYSSRKWATLGFVPGNGNSSENSQYEFVDINPEVGRNHYRLKQMDIDHNYVYSLTIEVAFDAINSHVRIYPNPVQDKVKIEGDYLSYDQLDIRDAANHLMKSYDLNEEAQEIDLSNLVNGIYIFQFVKKGVMMSKIVVKQ